MREMLNKDKENDRLRYIAGDEANEGEREMFNSSHLRKQVNFGELYGRQREQETGMQRG